MGVLSTAFADMEMRLYTAKGCPHCQHIEPAWNSVQAEIQGKAKVGLPVMCTVVSTSFFARLSIICECSTCVF